MSYSPLLIRLIDSLRCMPGVGRKSAQRIAFQLLERDRGGATILATALTAQAGGHQLKIEVDWNADGSDITGIILLSDTP